MENYNMTVLNNVKIEYEEAENLIRKFDSNEINHLISKLLREEAIKKQSFKKIDNSHIEPVSNEEQKELEDILNSMSEDDKKIVSSKIITIDI